MLAQSDRSTQVGERETTSWLPPLRHGGAHPGAPGPGSVRRPIRPTPFVRLFGKGRRERLTPLLPQTARLVRRFLAAAGRREEAPRR